MQREKIPPGTLILLVLKVLSRGPLHGYGIAKRIREMSNDVLQAEEGSLYPALQRMLRNGWVTAEWVPAGAKRRVRVYQLTPEGRNQLEAEVSWFNRVFGAISRVIQPA